jgi:hypothetical protein
MNYEKTYPHDESVIQDNFDRDIKVKKFFAAARVFTIVGLALWGSTQGDPVYVIGLMILVIFGYELAYFQLSELQRQKNLIGETSRVKKYYYHLIDAMPKCIPEKYYRDAILLKNPFCCKKQEYSEKNVHAFTLQPALEILNEFKTNQNVYVAELLVADSSGCVVDKAEHLSHNEYKNHELWSTPRSINKNLNETIEWLAHHASESDETYVIFNKLIFERE